MKAFLLKHSEALLISLLAIIAPIKGMIVVAALSVFVDFLTGMYAAHKRGEKIKSSKMAVTVTKLFVIETAILMCFFIQTFLLDNAFPLTSWVAGLIGTQQIYSIMENLNSISGGKLFSDILTKLQSINATKKDEKKSE